MGMRTRINCIVSTIIRVIIMRSRIRIRVRGRPRTCIITRMCDRIIMRARRHRSGTGICVSTINTQRAAREQHIYELVTNTYRTSTSDLQLLAREPSPRTCNCSRVCV